MIGGAVKSDTSRLVLEYFSSDDFFFLMTVSEKIDKQQQQQPSLDAANVTIRKNLNRRRLSLPWDARRRRE
jgi:hypothetical protein